MNLKLSQSLTQKLILSQRMKQSLSILSFSHEELKEEIEKELLENPFLEASEKEDEAPYFRLINFHSNSPVRGLNLQEKNKQVYIDSVEEELSLKSFVLRQAQMSNFPQRIKILLTFLISFLDDKGYLNVNLSELAIEENISLSYLKEALCILQSFEPSGIGGKNLKECLLIQLRQKKDLGPIPSLIVKNHLKNLQEKKYHMIACDLNLSLEMLTPHIKTILSLEPNPGRPFTKEPTVFVHPDLYIFKLNGNYCVYLNQEDLPQLSLSSSYKTLIKSKTLNHQEKKYFKERVGSAYWFMQSLRQRQEKIKKLAYKLIHYQKDFLEKGEAFLRPLKMQDIAQEMSLHLSTVSRIVNNKYVYTDQGVISLKSFFQKGILTTKGSVISFQFIKRTIKKWIEEEDFLHPLSDEEICEKIKKHFSIKILRRSVSEYRVSMGIPTSRQRKRIALYKERDLSFL